MTYKNHRSPDYDPETEIVLAEWNNPDGWIRSDTWIPEGEFR